jgi:hypothetical protein
MTHTTCALPLCDAIGHNGRRILGERSRTWLKAGEARLPSGAGNPLSAVSH